MTGASAHLVPLGRTGWSLWREGALRSAGFPAAGLLAVCDAELARTVDEAGAGADSDGGVYREASGRLSAAVAGVAADPVFREAVAWQNPALIGSCLDKLVRGEPRNVRGRLHEATVVRYLQRYSLKNDTIGFFGPVGWVTLSPECPGLEVATGPELLAGQTTHFEMWAVDEVAQALAGRPELRDWLTPRRALAVTVTGGVLHRPLGVPVRLTEDEVAVFGRCDGRRTAAEVTRDTGLEPLLRLAKLGAVHIGLDGPVDSWPERALRRKLEAVTDESAAVRALADVDALITARDEVGAARSAEDVVKRTGELARIFQEITGGEATRRPGEAYAGRTLVYQDTRRDVSVSVGSAVLDELAAPLGLVLDSARWLVARVAAEYRELLAAMYEEEAGYGGHQNEAGRSRHQEGVSDGGHQPGTDCGRYQEGTGSDGPPGVPLTHLIARTAADLTASGHCPPPPVQVAVAEFQRRWRRVLSWPDGVRRHSVTAASLAEGVAHEFAVAAAPWRTAMHHSPDIMIAAASPEAVADGHFLLVLGELHLAVNSLDNRFFVQHHDDAARLRAAAEADFGDTRIYAALPKKSPFVSSRVWPPITLLSPHYTYWTWSGAPSSIDPPGPVLPGARLTVHRRDGRLCVTCGDADVEYDLLEVLGEILSTAVVNAFRPFPAAPHRPRVTIGRLVIARESWTFAAADSTWAFIKDEAVRYAAARVWRAAHGLPERVFAVLPVERKPIGVDFTSLALVNILAKEIRRTAEAGAPTFTLSEMLPDLDELWLHDQAGQRYTAELRLVAVDERARAGAATGQS